MRFTSKKFLPAALIGLATTSLLACSASTDTSSTEEVEDAGIETSAPASAEEITTSSSTMSTLPPVSETATTTPVVLMPNVVCMNLQAAQDEIQKNGVFFSRSDDATGMNRSQLIDRNWIVIKQTPLPGQPVAELEAVLSAVKYGESTGGVC